MSDDDDKSRDMVPRLPGEDERENGGTIQLTGKKAAQTAPKGTVFDNVTSDSTSLNDRKKVKTPSNKGTLSKSDSPWPTSKSNTSRQGIPKFNDRGICVRCNSDQSVSESICCHLCGDRFHACCREKRGPVSS